MAARPRRPAVPPLGVRELISWWPATTVGRQILFGQGVEFLRVLAPGLGHGFDSVGIYQCQVFDFRTVLAEVEEFPGFGVVGHEFPITDPNGAIAIVVEP